MDIDRNQYVKVAIRAAREAGDLLMKRFGHVQTITSKGDRNLATDVDQAAEKLIVDIISESFPDHALLGEEATDRKSDSDYLWIIDPLDGTHNFIRGINIFGVSIGLWHRDDFVAGVVYMPNDQELYYAAKGEGAFKNGNPISVTSTAVLKEASCSFDSSLRYSPDVMLKVLGEVSANCFNVRMLGSSARLLTYVAEGTLDFAIEFYDRPWDFAGSVCLIREAGGVFSDLKGGEPGPATVGYVASNAALYDMINGIVSKNLRGG
jgi:myo-inositol-1(or 4)-monophosphatase